jgi:O-methyltransferase
VWYEPAKKVLRKLRLIPPVPPEPWPCGFGDSEKRICETVQPYTVTDRRRVLALVEAVRHVVRAGVPGDIVECGVFRGGSMMAVALTLLELGVRDRDLRLYDTFEGMSAPTKRDVAEPTGMAATDKFPQVRHENGEGSDWCFAPLEEVRRNMESTGYPAERVHYVKGKVEDTLPAQAPERIALLRLDTDFYESTLHEMRHLWPRLSRGGVIMIDDYLWWRGAREAVDEYIREHQLKLFLCPVDGGCVAGVKTDV